MADNEPVAASAEQLLALYPRLGVPHFQRGLVWNEDGTSLLLESLYTGTPCGNIILWRPRRPEVHGVPLDEAGCCERLIVDGQQRTRMLHEAFRGTDRAWCLDLAAEPLVSGLLAADPRSRLFVAVSAAGPSGHLRLRANVIPLRDFWDDRKTPAQLRERVTARNADSALDDALTAVRARVREMRTRRVFAIITLSEANGRYGIDEVVSLYNRINSAGRRVEAEEIAYAALVRSCPETTDHLRRFFAAVHGEKDTRHDRLLKREQERKFGFKLYLRTLVQVCNYHSGRSPLARGLSFDLLKTPWFHQEVRDHPERARALFQATHEILVCVRRVLREVLFCDDLRMLPDSECLLPALHLLLRFPQLREQQHDRATAWLLLRTVIHPDRTQEHTMKALQLIERSHTAAHCLARLREHWGDWTDSRRRRFEEALAAVGTLADRYVLLLYWLVRKHKAKDFSYLNLDPSQTLYEVRGNEPLVACDVSPEKQHIMPSAALGKSIFGGPGRITTTHHPVNNIGNLTFISEKLNSFITGLGDRWIDPINDPIANLERHFLADEALEPYEPLRERFHKGLLSPADRENFERHFLADEVLGPYETLRKPPQEETLSPAHKEHFDRFCKARRRRIQAAFEAWIAELEPHFTVGDQRFEPAARLQAPDIGDEVRALDYPDRLEDAIFRLLDCPNVGPLAPSRRKGRPGNAAILVQEPGRPQGFCLFFSRDPRQVWIEERRECSRYELLLALAQEQQVPLPERRSGYLQLDCAGENESKIVAVLERLAAALRA